MTDAPTDPRVARTRRDVVDATAALLVDDGWDAVTHAEVAKRSGYAKATVYTHWPTRLDLVRSAIEQICDIAHHPEVTGELRTDLRVALADFANDLDEGHLDRLLAGVVERARQNEIVGALRGRLYESGTAGLRSILESHLDETEIEPALALLTGAVMVRVTFEGKPATAAYIDDVIERVLGSTGAAAN
jgi:AcrR family transcriptional regulator